MAQQIINIGSAAGDGTGDPLRTGGQKINENFTELYNTRGVTAANVIVINAEADFPTQDASTITLESGNLYFIGAPFTTLKSFIVQDAVTIESANAQSIVITYGGGGTMFSSTDATWTARNIGFSCPSATFFSSSGGIVQFLNMVVASCLNIGSLTQGTGISALIADLITFLSVSSQGFTFSGNLDVLSASRITILSTSSSHISLNLGTTVFQTIEIENVRFFGVSGSTALSGLASSANMQPNTIAQVTSSTFNGNAMTPLSGIDPTDIRWNFQLVEGVENSASIAETHLSAAQTVTIASTSTFELVGGANWVVDFDDRFTVTTAGLITYISEQSAKFRVLSNASIEKVGGGSDELEMRIRLNSTDEFKTRSFTDNSNPTMVVCSGIFTLNTGDTIQISVANNNSTSNIIVDAAIIDISEI